MFQLLGCHFEVLVETCVYDDRYTASQFHHLWIAYPVRCRDDDLITRIYQGEYCVADALLAASTYDYLIGSIVKIVLVFQFGNNCFSQVRVSWNRRVTRVIFVDSLFGCLFDVVRCVEIGFSHAHVDYVDSLSLHFTTFLRHRQRC